MEGARWLTPQELEERRDEWRNLAAGSEFPTAFVAPAWILAWWQHYGEGHEPWSLALEGPDGSLRGLALLALRRSRLTRTLTFVGARWNSLETLVSAPGCEAELVAALSQALAQRSREWDLWRIGRLPTDSLLARSLLGAEHEIRAAAHDLRLQPYLELPGEAEVFEAQFNSKRRSEFRRRWRRLMELGARPRLVADPDEARGTVAQLLQMRRERALTKHQSHAHLDARFERFLTDAVHDLLPEGARLWTLELDDRILTAKLNLVQGPREHGYLVGLSDEHLSLSPGHALERHMIIASIADGRAEFDFGAGRDDYKYRWGAIDREVARIAVASPSPRGRLAGAPVAIDLRLRNTAAAERLRQRRGIATERATAEHPAHRANPATPVRER